MKAVTKYETQDGKVFDSKAEAKAHSDVLELSEEIYTRFSDGVDLVEKNVAEQISSFLLKKYRMLPLVPKKAEEPAAA